MKRADYAVIRQARDHLLTLSSGLTSHELAAMVFGKFPRAWELLCPDLQAKWCWEQRRRQRDDSQLPLDGIFDDVVTARAEWDADQTRLYAQRYDLAAKRNIAMRDRLLADYYARTHVQLELWPEDADSRR